MNKLLLSFLLFSVTTANAQTPSNNSSLDNFTTTLAKSGLSEVTRTKIKNLIIARDQTLAENKKSQEAQEANNPIAFQDSETTPKFCQPTVLQITLRNYHHRPIQEIVSTTATIKNYKNDNR
jgi:hypothetical protein